MKILLIENDLKFLELIEKSLLTGDDKINVEIITISNVYGEIEKYLTVDFDIIVMGLLSKGDAISEFLYVKSQFSAVPIVVHGSVSNEVNLKEAVKHGAENYIVNEEGNIVIRLFWVLKLTMEKSKIFSKMEAATRDIKLILENYPGAVYWKDLEGNLLGYNSEYLKIKDYIIDESIYVKPGDKERILKVSDIAMTTGVANMGAIERVKCGNKYSWIKINRIPIKISGNSVGLFLTIEKIDSEMKKDTKIKIYNQIVDFVAHSIITTDKNGDIVNVNKSTEKLFMQSREYMAGRNISEFFLYKEAYQNLVERVNDENEMVTEGEVEMIGRNDFKFISEVKFAPIFDEDGEIIYYTMSQQDVTEKVHNREAIKLVNKVLRMNSNLYIFFMENIVCEENITKSLKLIADTIDFKRVLVYQRFESSLVERFGYCSTVSSNPDISIYKTKEVGHVKSSIILSAIEKNVVYSTSDRTIFEGVTEKLLGEIDVTDVIAIPMFIRNNLWGCLVLENSLSDEIDTNNLPEHVTDSIRITANVLCSAISTTNLETSNEISKILERADRIQKLMDDKRKLSD